MSKMHGSSGSPEREPSAQAKPTTGGPAAAKPSTLKSFPSAQTYIPVTAEDFDRSKRRKMLWIAMAVVVAGGIGGYFYKRSSDPAEAALSYDAGVRLLSSGRYQEAILNFSQAIERNSGLSDAYRMRARAHITSYNAEAAIADLTQVCKLRPQDASSYLERGAALLELKRYDEALADADRAIEIDKKLAKAFNLRGNALRLKRDFPAAIEAFGHALEITPDLDNYVQRAQTYQLTGQHDLAIADFDKAITIDPEEPHIFYARATSKTALGDDKGAGEDIAKGRKLDGF